MIKQRVGTKIRNFRKRSGLSQFDLEIQIGASPGSISRIENSQVNPTKETLEKISLVLELSDIEKTRLYNISSSFFSGSIMQLAELVSKTTLDDLYQSAVSTLLSELKLEGILILLFEGDLIKGRAITRLPIVPAINKVMGKDFTNLVANWKSKEFEKSLMSKVILENVPKQSYKLSDFACPPLTFLQANIIEKISGYKAGICYPLNFNGIMIGTIVYTRNYKDDFSLDLNTLSELSRIIGYKVGSLVNILRIS